MGTGILASHNQSKCDAKNGLQATENLGEETHSAMTLKVMLSQVTPLQTQ